MFLKARMRKNGPWMQIFKPPVSTGCRVEMATLDHKVSDEFDFGYNQTRTTRVIYP